MTTTKELIADLTERQLVRLEEVKAAKVAKDASTDIYAKAAHRAHEDGVSYGIIGHVVGAPREAVWRSVQRWKEGKEWRYRRVKG